MNPSQLLRFLLENPGCDLLLDQRPRLVPLVAPGPCRPTALDLDLARLPPAGFSNLRNVAHAVDWRFNIRLSLLLELLSAFGARQGDWVGKQLWAGGRLIGAGVLVCRLVRGFRMLLEGFESDEWLIGARGKNFLETVKTWENCETFCRGSSNVSDCITISSFYCDPSEAK